MRWRGGAAQRNRAREKMRWDVVFLSAAGTAVAIASRRAQLCSGANERSGDLDDELGARGVAELLFFSALLAARESRQRSAPHPARSVLSFSSSRSSPLRRTPVAVIG